MGDDELRCREESALGRLVTQAGPGQPPVPYGAHPDQVYEEHLIADQVSEEHVTGDHEPEEDTPELRVSRDVTEEGVSEEDVPEGQVLEDHGPADGPLVVVVHGGFWRTTIDRAHARPQARALARAGYRVVLAEYRRVPGDPTACLDDLRALRRHMLARPKRDGGRDAVWLGHSAGGTLVLLMSLLDGVRSVALAPVADLAAARRDRLGDGAVDKWLGEVPSHAFDPARLLVSRPEAADRVLLIHGSDDITAPPSQSISSSAPSVVLDGAHHYDLIDPASPHWPAVLDRVGAAHRRGSAKR